MAFSFDYKEGILSLCRNLSLYGGGEILNDLEPKGYVNKLHLIYVTICLVITIIGILVISIWHQEKTSIGLNNAATAASIVLAVVAIVITLVDVAGQRNTVADLKETAEKLSDNLSEVNESISEIRGLKTELMDSMAIMLKSSEETSRGIISLKEKYSKIEAETPNSQSNKSIVNDLEELRNSLNHRILDRESMYNDNNKREFRKSLHTIELILHKVFNTILKDDIPYEFNIIWQKVKDENMNISRSELELTLDYLMKKGIFEKINGRLYRLIR